MDGRLRRLYRGVSNRYPAIGRLARATRPRTALAASVVGQGNTIERAGAVLDAVVLDIHGNRNIVRIEDGCSLNSVLIRIRGDDHSVSIGRGCRFNEGGSIWLEDSGCEVRIGAACTFEAVHLAVTEPGSKLTIGRDCMFAYDIDIRTGDSHSIIDAATNLRINDAKDVVIGEHVWVAAHCRILKGVVIPDGSVVATGSIVTEPFAEPGIVLAGNPARVARRGVR